MERATNGDHAVATALANIVRRNSRFRDDPSAVNRTALKAAVLIYMTDMETNEIVAAAGAEAGTTTSTTASMTASTATSTATSKTTSETTSLS